MRLSDPRTLTLALAFCLSSAAIAENDRIGVGTVVAPAELKGYFAIPPSGAGLPPGHGTAREGAVVYAERCAGCHGAALEGNREMGGDRLVGGRGSLAGPAPMRTVESYWPYATSLFDYVKRSMPFDQPGGLTDSEVFAVTAFILARGGIIRAGQRMDARSLPLVRMPNRDGFDPAPEALSHSGSVTHPSE